MERVNWLYESLKFKNKMTVVYSTVDVTYLAACAVHLLKTY